MTPPPTHTHTRLLSIGEAVANIGQKKVCPTKYLYRIVRLRGVISAFRRDVGEIFAFLGRVSVMNCHYTLRKNPDERRSRVSKG